MSGVSLENGSDYSCVDCEVRLFKLKVNVSVSFVSFKNPSELQSISLLSKYVKIMSVVSLKNLDQLKSIALLVILFKLSRKENKSMGL